MNESSDRVDLLDALVAMIAHDLRSPITSIKGFSQLALREPDLSSQLRSCLAAVLKETNRLAAIVDDLELLSGHHAERASPRPAWPIGAVVRAAVTRARGRDPDLEVELEMPDADVSTPGDPTMIERAITLLIGTARRYGAEGGRITIRLSDRPDGALVTIFPGGRVSPETLATLRWLVDRERGGPAEQLTPSGFSLYVCQRLIEKQGGKVWIDASGNADPRFVLRLPALNERQHQTSPRGECQQWS